MQHAQWWTHPRNCLITAITGILQAQELLRENNEHKQRKIKKKIGSFQDKQFCREWSGAEIMHISTIHTAKIIRITISILCFYRVYIHTAHHIHHAGLHALP